MGASRGSVLLLGNYGPSLAIARSLAAAGFHVIGGNGGEYDILRSSRACHETWHHAPVTSQDELMSELVDFIRSRPDLSVILPVQSRLVELLARRGAELPAGPVVASTQDQVVLTCLSKPDLYKVAMDAGVPVARHRVATTDLDELRTVAMEVGYPLIVRPVQDALGSLPDGRKAAICADAAELESTFPQWPEGHAELLVQRFVQGPRHSISFVASGVRVTTIAQSSTLRTDRQDGTGFGVLHRTRLKPDDRLVDHTHSLALALGYKGYGTAQFIAPAEGEMTLLEINPRIGAGVLQYQHLAVDVPLITVELALGRDGWDFDAIETPIGGTKTAWSSRDFYRSITAWHEREMGAGETIRAVGRTLGTALTVRRHATLDWHDPMPTIRLYAHLLRLALRRRRPMAARPAASDPSRPAEVTRRSDRAA